MTNEDLEPYRAGIRPDCDLNTLHRSRHPYDESRIKILSGSRFLSRKNVTLLSGHDGRKRRSWIRAKQRWIPFLIPDANVCAMLAARFFLGLCSILCFLDFPALWLGRFDYHRARTKITRFLTTIWGFYDTIAQFLRDFLLWPLKWFSSVTRVKLIRTWTFLLAELQDMVPPSWLFLAEFSGWTWLSIWI